MNTPDALSKLMDECSSGTNAALAPFFESFLDSWLIVPERHQQVVAKIEPRYPSDFCNLLGVVDEERVVVPIFTDLAQMEEWAGRTLTARKYIGAELLKIVPDGWWCCLNPGQECCKEFSPWEVSELRHGKSAIPAVIEEYLSGEAIEPLTIGPVDENEHMELFTALSRTAKDSLPTVMSMHLVRETGVDDSGSLCSRLLLGAAVVRGALDSAELVRSRLEAVAGLHTIGADEIYVFVGETGNDKVMSGLFKDFSPFYSRN